MKTSASLGWDSFWRILALVTALTLVAYACTQPQVSNDFWLQAKVGEWIVQHGSIPKTLLFPFTQASEFRFNAHEWLPSLFFHYLIRIFGEPALPLLLGLAGILLFSYVCYLSTLRSGGNLGIGILCALVAMLLENYRHFLRPELLSLFLLLAFLQSLEKIRGSHSTWGFLSAIVLTIIWANSHASFVLAPLICALYGLGEWLDETIRSKNSISTGLSTAHPFFLLSIVLVFASALNPSGIDLLLFVFRFNDSQVSREFITEWFPSFDPRLRHTPEIWLASITMLLLCMTCIARMHKLRSSDILICFLFAILGIKAFRFLVYIGLIAALTIPIAFRGGMKAPIPLRILFQVSSTISMVLLFLAYHFGNINGNRPYYSDFTEVLTVGMIRSLSSADLVGNVYTSYDLGAELIYRAYPRLKPSIDSRIDSYGDAYFKEHEKLLVDQTSFTNFVQKYNVRYMLLTRDDFDIFSRQNPHSLQEWHIRTADSRSVLLEHHL